MYLLCEVYIDFITVSCVYLQINNCPISILFLVYFIIIIFIFSLALVVVNQLMNQSSAR